MKKTALTETHRALGAKMVSYAGFEMPLSYKGVNQEHKAVRENVGIFDVSHMGEFLVTGTNALPLIQRIFSNDAAKLPVGSAQYGYMPNLEGGIVDDLIIYRIKDEQYLMVVNAANIEKDWKHLEQYNIDFGAELKDLSKDYSLLSVQGPKAVEVLQQLSSVNLTAIEYYQFKVGDLAGVEYVILSATGYTGSGGFEIYCKNTEAQQIWNRLLEAGESFGIEPIGLAARNTLRLEMGYCLYGNEIDDTTSPYEAGLGWVTKYTKDFVNSEALKKEKYREPEKKLIGFECSERGIPREGYDLVDGLGKKIGRVTSGTMSPSLDTGIGLGYLPAIFAKPGSLVHVQIRKKMIPATVVKLPFYKG